MTSTDPIVTSAAPVITIDGPTAPGKGTVPHRVATAPGCAVLVSRPPYPLPALAAVTHGVDAAPHPARARVAHPPAGRFHRPPRRPSAPDPRPAPPPLRAALLTP
ncbi:hypothetical protein HGQ98_29245, partial [Achromobacter ruhlandii]